MPARPMFHEVDPRDELREKIGSLDDFEIFHNQVLCAIYMRPEKTRSGIILTDAARDEDKHQGKVGLIVKLGDKAFVPNEDWTWPDGIGLNDWVYYRASEGWGVSVNSVDCRILDDTNVRGRIERPDQVW